MSAGKIRGAEERRKSKARDWGASGVQHETNKKKKVFHSYRPNHSLHTPRILLLLLLLLLLLRRRLPSLSSRLKRTWHITAFFSRSVFLYAASTKPRITPPLVSACHFTLYNLKALGSKNMTRVMGVEVGGGGGGVCVHRQRLFYHLPLINPAGF